MKVKMKKSLQTDRQTEISNCNYVKTILMLLVVIGHATDFFTGTWFTAVKVAGTPSHLSIIPNWIGSFHIYSFALTSGFIFSYLQNRKHYKNFCGMIRKKIKRLILPFLFVSIVWAIPIGEFFYKYSLTDIAVDFLLGENPQQLWFLLMLFDVFILAWITETIFNKGSVHAVILGMLAYGIGVFGTHIFLNVYQIWTGFQYLPVFILGYKLWQDDKQNWIDKPLLWIVLHTTTFVLIQVIPDIGMTARISRIGLEFLNHTFGAMMAFTVLQWIAQRVNYADNRLYKILSKHSMTIYLFHQQIIYFAIWYLNGRINTILIAVLNFFIALAVSLLISEILSHWKITKLLIGEG